MLLLFSNSTNFEKLIWPDKIKIRNLKKGKLIDNFNLLICLFTLFIYLYESEMSDF